VDECKPLPSTATALACRPGDHELIGDVLPATRGLHSSTFQLNASVFCGIGGVFRGCLGGCLGGVRLY